MDNDTLKVVSATQKRNTLSGTKIFINAVIALFVSVALIISSFFLFGGLAMKLADWAFWLQKIISAVATFVLMLSISNITEEIARKRDKDLNDRLNALDCHYQDVMRGYETDKLEAFLENINKANKYNAFIARLKKKMLKAKGKKLDSIQKRLLITADELWNSGQRVKYFKVTYNQLVSGAFDVSASDSEYDLNVHKARYGAKKFGWKIISIVAFGGVVTDMVYTFLDFDRSMIMPLVLKVVTILVAVYSGVCYGYFIIERTKTVTKGKLRIFSKFRARVNSDLPEEQRFAVEIAKDIIVEKVKAQQAAKTDEKENLLKKTYADTFGNHQPVKVSGFIKRLVENAIHTDSQ